MSGFELAPGETFEFEVLWEAPHPTLPGTMVPVDTAGVAFDAFLRIASGNVALTVTPRVPSISGIVDVVGLPAATADIGKARGTSVWVGATPPNGRKVWLLKGENVRVLG